MQRNASLTEFNEFKQVVIDHNKRMSKRPFQVPKKEAQEKVLTWFF